jgi:hypothetical protein
MLAAALMYAATASDNSTVRIAPCSLPLTSNQTWRMDTTAKTILTAPYDGAARCMGIAHDVVEGLETCTKDDEHEADIFDCYAEGLTDCDHKNHQWSHLAPPSVCRCTALALRGKAGILHNSHSQKCLQADPWVSFQQPASKHLMKNALFLQNYTVFQKHCNDRNR